MRRYANRNRDMMGYDPGFQPPIKPPSQLDAKDERLLELSAAVGNLEGANDLLAEDNGRLEDENSQLRHENKELRERNKTLEERETEARAGYKSGQQLVDEIEEALKAKKGTKK